jgi:hypothetical protein
VAHHIPKGDVIVHVIIIKIECGQVVPYRFINVYFAFFYEQPNQRAGKSFGAGANGKTVVFGSR